MSAAVAVPGLPANVATVVSDFLDTCRSAYGGDLVSVVLYGSAAEGKMGPSSDVNVLVVLRKFSANAAATLRAPLLAAEAAIRLRSMFIEEGELADVASMFGQKFADMRRRHRVLFGNDVISSLNIPRSAEIFRLRQVLMNLMLRLRESSILRSERPAQAARILADSLGPLRASAATLLELEGHNAADANAALQSVAASCKGGSATAAQLIAAHSRQTVEGDAANAIFQASELARCMIERASRLS